MPIRECIAGSLSKTQTQQVSFPRNFCMPCNSKGFYIKTLSLNPKPYTCISALAPMCPYLIPIDPLQGCKDPKPFHLQAGRVQGVFACCYCRPSKENPKL